MNRIDRLYALLILLQGRKFTSIEKITERFGLSKRTVFRDIKALEEAGIPIGNEVQKGYFIVDGYFLPPITFTEEEAQAFILAEKFIDNYTDLSIQNHFEKGVEKIKNVLSVHTKESIEELSNRINIYRAPQKHAVAKTDQSLNTLQKALQKKQALQLTYKANYNQEESLRIVEPIGICHYGDFWHLIAWCRLRKAIRDFRVDRIQNTILLNDFYKVNDLDVEQYIQHYYQQSQELVEVKLKVSHLVVTIMENQKHYLGFLKSEKQEDGVFMTFLTSPTFTPIAHWILSFGNGVQIISPQGMKDKVKSLIEELSNHYL